MTINEYQKLAMTTQNPALSERRRRSALHSTKFLLEVHPMNEDQIFQLYNLLQSIISEDYYDEDDLKECKKLLRKATRIIEEK